MKKASEEKTLKEKQSKPLIFRVISVTCKHGAAIITTAERAEMSPADLLRQSGFDEVNPVEGFGATGIAWKDGMWLNDDPILLVFASPAAESVVTARDEFELILFKKENGSIQPIDSGTVSLVPVSDSGHVVYLCNGAQVRLLDITAKPLLADSDIAARYGEAAARLKNLKNAIQDESSQGDPISWRVIAKRLTMLTSALTVLSGATERDWIEYIESLGKGKDAGHVKGFLEKTAADINAIRTGTGALHRADLSLKASARERVKKP